MISTIRHLLTRLGVLTAHPLAFAIAGLYAALWYRFEPETLIGAVIAAILPLIVAAAVGEGWSMVLWTTALFLTVELLAGQVIEPMLYGHSSGLSPVAIVV